MPVSEKAQQIMRRIIDASNVDILLFNAPIERDRDRRLIRNCHRRKCRPNLLMLLVTEGGNPDAAYRIARCLQDRYEKFACFISGYCKSAGTLLLLGANELVFSEHGEIGPLDIQLAKKDELWESESGLTVMTAMSSLHENAQEAFDHFFISVSTRSGGRITVRTASEIAAKLTQALYSPISGQIDPIHMGEVYRSMAIAREYGKRLMLKSRNFNNEALNDLISAYPSHGFVIDREEAVEKFKNVRECTEDERALVAELGDLAQIPLERPVMTYISDDVKEQAPDGTRATQAETVLEQPGVDGTPTATTGIIQTNGKAGAIEIVE